MYDLYDVKLHIVSPYRSLSSTIGVMYRKSVWVMGALLSYYCAVHIDLGFNA